MSLMWLHVGYLCVTTKRQPSRQPSLRRADFPFQTAYKERFSPLALTQCTNITDTVRAEPGKTSIRSRVYVFNDILYLLDYYYFFSQIEYYGAWCTKDGKSGQQSRSSGLVIVQI